MIHIILISLEQWQQGVFSKTYYYDYYSDYKYYIADNNGHIIYNKGWIQNNFNWYYI